MTKAEETRIRDTYKASYHMYMKTMDETVKARKKKDFENGVEYPTEDDKKAIALIQNSMNSVKEAYFHFGGTEEELAKPLPGAKKKITKAALLGIVADGDNDTAGENLTPQDEVAAEDTADAAPIKPVRNEFDEASDYGANERISEENDILVPAAPEVSSETPKNALYDRIPLPSKGECYRNKFKSIPVAYLTAFDENLIVSPNLYADGTFIDELLDRKIMDKTVRPADLLPGDRDAIILWLRASGYGNDFPVLATDAETGTKFEATVDLSQIKYKEFTLKGDGNGYFDFALPVSGDSVKFRFLTYSDMKKLGELAEEEDSAVRKKRIGELADRTEELLDSDRSVSKTTKNLVADAVKNLRTYADGIDAGETRHTNMVTNRLIYSIVSVNGITDRRYISDYVRNMSVRDSSALRKYITANEPGLDYNVEVERPASLGGGSVKMFLTLDEYIFLSVAE